ncbi:MAG: UDP-N-acetylglucosamine 1-carboxyvinyltransferase [Patescibacteria group bacterium]
MKFVIKGGNKLIGEIKLAGAKNAATKMLVASLLTSEPCVLENFPDIGDTKITEELCRSVGSKISREGSVLKIETPEITNSKVVSLTRRNRIPILALGPLLSRVGEAEVPVLGGDRIGPRPVDIHIDALTAMGAKIETLDDRYVASAPQGLHGAEIRLRYPSVGATENTILAAVLAKGRTEIQNAATEPEILDLIKLLQKMGAIIEFGANRTIYIDGVDTLHGATHRIMPDRNEAVSFACLAVATNGRILVQDAHQESLLTFLNVLRRVGGDYKVLDSGIEFWKAVDGPLNPTMIETDTYPGFMTDWQQPVAVLLTQADGVSSIHETVYEDRFGYAQDLNLMGAEIKVQAKCLGELSCRFSGKDFLHSAQFIGPRKLHAANLTVRDLRSGIAHVIAALTAEGESVIDGIEELDRGYERIDERLRALNANIQRISN